MIYLWNAFIILASFVLMEMVAWTMHKYLMHGFLWYLHKDHHYQHTHFFEKNDLFAFVFFIPSWLLMMFSIMDGCDYRLYMGIGITIYGICYFLIHDGLIHRRVKILSNSKNPLLLALKNGHLAHHKNDNKPDYKKENDICYGMLWVPIEFFIEARKRKKQSIEK